MGRVCGQQRCQHQHHESSILSLFGLRFLTPSLPPLPACADAAVQRHAAQLGEGDHQALPQARLQNRGPCRLGEDEGGQAAATQQLSWAGWAEASPPRVKLCSCFGWRLMRLLCHLLPVGRHASHTPHPLSHSHLPPSCVQASTSVRHLLLPCHWSQRSLLVPDLVKCYGERPSSRGAGKEAPAATLACWIAFLPNPHSTLLLLLTTCPCPCPCPPAHTHAPPPFPPPLQACAAAPSFSRRPRTTPTSWPAC